MPTKINVTQEAKNFLMAKPFAAMAALKRLNVYSIKELDIYVEICRENPRAADVIYRVAQSVGLA